MNSEQQQIKIALVDDHAMFRAGLVAIFEPLDHIEVLFETANGHEFLNFLKQQLPDVIIVDLKMPSLSGQHIISVVREQYPEVKVIVLSMYDEESIILNCLKELRVNSYLLKSSHPRELEEAIVKVYEEGFYFTPHISETMFHGLRKRRVMAASPHQQLTISEREREVMHLICQGQTNAEIAELLFISKRTVEGHRKNLLEKTHCKNTASLVAFAIQRKLVTI